MIIKDHCTVVVTGSLNPPAIQPWWLSRVGLVSEDEATSARVEAITSEFSVFEVGTWIRFEVIRNRFTAAVLNGEADKLRLRDVVCGIFSALPHTPITAVGLNRAIQFNVSTAVYHSIGHSLAPKTFWDRHLKAPGMKSLSIRGERSDGQEGEINVTVAPVFTATNPSVVEVSYNSHFALAERSVGKDAIPLVQRELEPALRDAQALALSLIDGFSKDQK